MTDPDEGADQAGLRVRPEQALRPGRTDARNLLIVWYVRKSFYWLLFAGLIGAYATRRTDEIAIDWSDPGAVWAELLSPLAGLVLAVAVRLGSSVAALALAYPLARDHDLPLQPRTGVAGGIGRWLDRRNVAKAYRSLRSTHHVRQVALQRLGPTGTRVSILDPILDVANTAAFATMVVVVFTTPPT